ncbi:hypothetical protein GCM10011488_30450 [Steroidobacter agaridevorans]|nr:hypothetical protein GCM10011488_30450 [Steroidobacter agaridevorans]
MLFGRNADARVPHFDAHAVAPLAARNDHAASLGVAKRIRDQIGQHSEQQGGIRVQHASRAAHDELESLFFRRLGERAAQTVEHQVRRHDFFLDFDLAGIELGNIEQVIEQLLQRFGGLQDLIDHAASLFVHLAIAQSCREQAERMQWLPQVVIRSREEQRFRSARGFGAGAGLVGERILLL